jgi:thymidine phosphorylase
VRLEIEADRSGTVASMRTEDIGPASGALGAGRARKGDAIDPAVGIVVRCKIGDRLERGEPIGTVHARDTDAAVTAVARVQAALEMGDAPVTVPPLVHGWIE